MKKMLFALIVALPTLLVAQNTEGVITYEEIIKLKIQLSPEMQQYASMIPSEEKTNMDLFFTAKESFYTKSKKVEEAESNPFEGNDVNVKKMVIGGGGSTQTYYNLEDNTGLQAEDLMGKKFLVTLDREKQDWRVLGEQKVIGGYNCIKAEMMVDSTNIAAWFTPQIPVSVGPAGFYGLPGAILFLEMSGKGPNISFTAKEIKLEKLENPIEAPSKGKKVSEEEFEAIVEKQMKEMRAMQGKSDASSSGNNIEIKIIQN